MNLFDPNTVVGRVLTYLGNLIALNFLFLLCCLPIVTIGPALSAMYSITLREWDTWQGALSSSFFAAFKENLKKGIALWLIVLLFACILAFNFLFITANAALIPGFFRVIVWIALVMFLIFSPYVFPLQAHYENTVKNTLKNAFVLGYSRLPKTVLMIALNALPFVLLYLSQALFLRLAIIWVFIGFSATARINSLLLNTIFQKLEPTE